MLNKLFKSSIKKSTCVTLYTFDYNRTKTQELFEFVKQYLNNQLNVEFTFASFFNETYDVKYGKIGDVEVKLKKEEPSNLVNFSLHKSDLRKSLSEVNVEFNFTRPVSLTLQMPDDVRFDILSFAKCIRTYFSFQYGFVYKPLFDKWSTAYANGDQQHVKSENGFVSFEKAPLKRWFNECEKISAGYIRDIFQENFIIEKHLDFDIRGENLRQIIVLNNLGSLEPIEKEAYYWKLTQDQLDLARKLLYNSGILI